MTVGNCPDADRIDTVAEPVANTSILLAVVLGYYMFGEKIQARLIASVLMIIGVFLLAFG